MEDFRNNATIVISTLKRYRMLHVQDVFQVLFP